MKKQKIILFDIDYTLFDTTTYKKNIAEQLAKSVTQLHPEKAYISIEEIYYDVRQFGSFDPEKFASLFVKRFPGQIKKDIVERIWWEKRILQAAIYPEVVPTLKSLQTNNVLGIFSSGKTEFQLAKISHLQDFFQKDHVHIATFKEEKITELLGEYKSENIVLVDDYIEILLKAKQHLPNLCTIWMKRGKFAEKATMPLMFTPDAIITSLDELPELVDNNIVG